MQSSLKKSLYLGLAAASFVAVAGTTSANASAKSYAKAGAYTTLTTPASSRNVNLTGTNAVYTKPGTVKGAKLVATTTTAAKLSKSNQGSANFRAYGVKTTDRGSVYYKVVSFDGQYRGYVYGGKSTSAFAGGLTAYATTKDATAPKTSDTYKLSADTSSTANTLFFKEPAWTNYKVGRAKVAGKVLAATDAYKGAAFTFDKAATTSREGETWYEIASTTLANGTKTTDLNGAWVKASDVKNPNAASSEDNSVTIKYVDDNNNAVGNTALFTTTSTTTRKGDQIGANTDANHLDVLGFAQANIPAGYAYGFSKANDANNAATTDPQNANAALVGGTLVVHVHVAATSKVNFLVDTDASAVNNHGVALETPTNLKPGDDISGQVSFKSLSDAAQASLIGEPTEKVDAQGIANALFTGGKDLNKLEGTQTYKGRDGKNYHYEFTFKATPQFVTDNHLALYGQNLKAAYVADLVEGSGAAASTNTNYVAK